MSLWNDKEMTLNPYDKKPCTFEGYYDKLIGQIGNDGSTFQSASETLTGHCLPSTTRDSRRWAFPPMRN